MLNIFNINRILGVFLFGLAFTQIDVPVSKAQNKPAELPTKIEVGETKNWDFSSENQEISIEDDLRELGKYQISKSDLLNVEINKENHKWYNQNYSRRYTLEAEVYDY